MEPARHPAMNLFPAHPPASHARTRGAGVSPDDNPASPAPAGRREPTIGTNRILVVDDDANLRNFVALTLRRTGFQVNCADDGESGWDAICEACFDLIITDHEMPRLTGLDLIRRVRARPLVVPVILTSGRMPCKDPELLPLLQPGLMLAKPFTHSDLLAKVRVFLSPAVPAGELSAG